MDLLTDECMTVDCVSHSPGWSDVGVGTAYQKSFSP